MQQRRFEPQNYDYKGVIVVASAWLVLYGLLFIGFASTKATNIFATLN